MALRGIRVLEMAGLAPAPFCGKILCDHGASLIRVDREGQLILDTFSAGKRSILLNLKDSKGVDILNRLIKNVDILIEPYRPGVMEKLGIGPDEAMVHNPQLIYARLSGFGQSGPMSKVAGHDINFLSLSGVLSRLGGKGAPMPPCNFLGDFAGGSLVCAMGIAMALFERCRSGRGQVIDAGMMAGALYVSGFAWHSKPMQGILTPAPRGNNLLDGGSPFYRTYETADGGYMAVGSLEPQFSNALLKGLGLYDKYKDVVGIFVDCTDSDQITRMSDDFATVFLSKTRDEWTDIFSQLDACVTPVLEMDEAETASITKHLFSQTPHGFAVPKPAPNFSRTPPTSVAEYKRLIQVGQHSREILIEANFTNAEIADLISNGVVTQAKISSNL